MGSCLYIVKQKKYWQKLISPTRLKIGKQLYGYKKKLPQCLSLPPNERPPEGCVVPAAGVAVELNENGEPVAAVVLLV